MRTYVPACTFLTDFLRISHSLSLSLAVPYIYTYIYVYIHRKPPTLQPTKNPTDLPTILRATDAQCLEMLDSFSGIDDCYSLDAYHLMIEWDIELYGT